MPVLWLQVVTDLTQCDFLAWEAFLCLSFSLTQVLSHNPPAIPHPLVNSVTAVQGWFHLE